MTLQEDCVLGQRELIRRVPDGDGLARAADALNAARLIEREQASQPHPPLLTDFQQ